MTPALAKGEPSQVKPPDRSVWSDKIPLYPVAVQGAGRQAQTESRRLPSSVDDGRRQSTPLSVHRRGKTRLSAGERPAGSPVSVNVVALDVPVTVGTWTVTCLPIRT